MIDLLFSAGQAMSVMGLAYGCYLSLSGGGRTRRAPAATRDATPVDHGATA